MEIRPTPPLKEIIQPLKINEDKPKKDGGQKHHPSKGGESKEEKKDHQSKHGDKIDFFA